MVALTDRAKVALKSALSQSIDEAGVGLRLDVSEGGGFALYPDTPKAGDEVVTGCDSRGQAPRPPT